MNSIEEDRSYLRWGGLASIGGGLLLILVFVIVIVFAGPDPAGLDGPIRRFPDIRVERIVENGLYLAVMALWVPLFPALYRRLRGTRPAPALFGAILNILGIAVLAAGALPHVATGRLADLYHAPGATAGDRAGLVLVWQATQGIFDALLLAGLLLMAAGVVLLGSAMVRDRTFGKGVATVGLLLGIAALGAGVTVLIDPGSPLTAIGFFALIAFHLVLGVKVYRLSRIATRTGLPD
jgi:hypothetical protein